MDILLERKSIRNYTSEDIKESDLEYILRAAMSAPSAVNARPWMFLIIKNKETHKKISEIHGAASMILEAPLAIVVCGDKSKVYKDYLPQDCAAASQNILLAAVAKQYGAVWCGIYSNKERQKKFKELFNLPENIEAFSLIVIGKPADTSKPKDRFDPQKIKYEVWK